MIRSPRWGAREAIAGLALVFCLGAAPLPHDTQREADERVLEETRALFAAYEQGNAQRFRGSPGFRSSGGATSGLIGPQLYRSVNNDLSNLRGIQFSTYVHTPVWNPTHTTARVGVTWFRRASFASSGEEWIVRAQTSILVFDTSAGAPELARLEGAPLFGLSDALDTMVVDRGEINGVRVTGRRTVRNGRLEPAASTRPPFPARPAAPAPATIKARASHAATACPVHAYDGGAR